MTKAFCFNNGIPPHEPELTHGPKGSDQFFYTDVCGRDDEHVGHFVHNEDGTITLELPTSEQAEAVRFALNNPARMALVMRMCGFPFSNCGVRKQIEPTSPATLQRIADKEAWRVSAPLCEAEGQRDADAAKGVDANTERA